MKKRIFSLILAMIMTASVLASCKKDDVPETPDTEKETVAAETSAPEKETEIDVGKDPEDEGEEMITLAISTAEEFIEFFNNLHAGFYAADEMLVTLEADIDLGGQVLQTNPSGSFMSDFDGKGHTLSNFVLEATNGRGLLGCATKSNDRYQYVKNLVIEGAQVKGLEDNDRQTVLYGGCLAQLYFENVYISGSIDCKNGAAFVGHVMDAGSATFKNCVSAVTIADKESAAGFVGIADYGYDNLSDPADGTPMQRVRMENCAFYGTLGGDTTAAFVGSIKGEVLFKNCIAMPTNGDGNRLFYNGEFTTVNAGTANVISAGETAWPDGTNTGIIAASQADIKGGAWNFDWDGWIATADYPLPASLAEMMEIEPLQTLAISTAEEFIEFFNNLHAGFYAADEMLVTLEADIDLGGQVLQTNPSGSFMSDFDGKGHTLSNFVLEATNGRGLLGCATKSNDRYQYVKNLVIEGAEVKGLEDNDRQTVLYGGCLAQLYFENVYISGSIDCKNGAAFVGHVMDAGSATFKNCVSAVTIADKESAAGFVGIADYGYDNLSDPADGTPMQRVRMENCAFYGTLGGDTTAAFVGSIKGEVLFKNCIAMPTNGDGNRLFYNGEFTTVNAGTANVISAGETAWPDGTNTGIIAASQADIKGGAWNFDWDGWIATADYPLPASLAEMMEIEPLQTLAISTAEEFIEFFNNLHAGFYAADEMLVTLEADIDLGGQVLQTNPSGSFMSDFDGKGHTLSNFVLEATNGRGLLGCATKSNDRYQYVKNLVIEGAEVKGLEDNDRQTVLYGGCLAQLYFENVYISGSIDCKNGAAFVGHVMDAGSATFKNCVSAVTIADKESAAGFVGIADYGYDNLSDPADGTPMQRVRMENCAFYGTLGGDTTAAFVGSIKGEVLFKNCIAMPTNGDGNRLFYNGEFTTVNAGTANVISAGETAWPDGTNTGIIAASQADIKGGAWNFDWDGWIATADYPLPASLAEMMGE